MSLRAALIAVRNEEKEKAIWVDAICIYSTNPALNTLIL